MRPRAIAYLRISDDPNEDRLAVKRQEDDARSLAARYDVDLADEDIHIDNDTSATSITKSRAEFEKAMTKIDNSAQGIGRKIQLLIAYKIDRITRKRIDTVRVIEAGQAAKIKIVLTSGLAFDLATPEGRSFMDSVANFARMEIEIKHDRQVRKNQQRRDNGLAGPSHRPFGYTASRNDLEHDEANAIRDAYAWLLEGMSLGAIARRWNDLGLHTPQRRSKRRDIELGDHEWVGNSVGPVLRNPRNMGAMTYLPLDKDGKRGKRMIIGEAKWPKIIDETTFYAAQSILDDPKRKTTRADKALLTGVAVCAICNGRVAAANNGTHALYRCRDHQHFHRQRDPIDSLVRETMITRISTYAAHYAAQPIDIQSPIGALHAKRLEHIKSRELLDHRFYVERDPSLTEDRYRRIDRALADDLRSIDDQLASIETDTISARLKALSSADDIESAWDDLDRDIQRQLIDATLIIRIDRQGKGAKVFKPESVIIEPKMK